VTNQLLHELEVAVDDVTVECGLVDACAGGPVQIVDPELRDMSTRQSCASQGLTQNEKSDWPALAAFQGRVVAEFQDVNALTWLTRVLPPYGGTTLPSTVDPETARL
jgi:hypothetical protein